MIKHNLLLIFRNFKRNKSSFFINLIGLSTGLACFLLIYLWVEDELNMNKFHENHHRIYRVIEHLEFSEGIRTMMETVGPMAEFLADEMPEVEYSAVTIQPSWFGKHLLSVEDKHLKATGQLVSKDYFNIFSFKLLQGDKDWVMADPNSIVLSRELAVNLFGSTDDVVGKYVEFEHKRQFQVSGIFENTPSSSTQQFDFTLSTEASRDEPPWNSLHSWNSSGPQVYVLVKEGTDIDQLNEKVEKIHKNRNENTIRTATLIPFSSGYLYGTYENGKQVGGRIQYVRLFSIIALIILVIACINFMNLSTARASIRLKEIGVKKAIGVKRKTLILQFLGESVAMTILALLLAVVLVIIFLPRFNDIVGKQLVLNPEVNLVAMITGIVIFTGLIAGSYPAFYLSGFKTVAVLKGKLNGSFGEFLTRKGLVTVQFALSVVLIVSVLVVYRQIEFVQSQNLGYNQDNVVYFKIEGAIKDQLQTFTSEAGKLPGIMNVSSTTHSMVGHNWSTDLYWEGKDPDRITSFQIVGVDYDFIKTMGIEMSSGRDFSREFGTDSTAIIFNETAIRSMDIEDPLGKIINGELKIIGIVKDFHFKSLHDKIEPLFLTIMPNSVKYVMVRIQAGMEHVALENLGGLYKDFNPGFPFEYGFLDERFQAQYMSEQRVATLSKYFAGLAILISCLGLFGLAAFTAERRLKEIGIRKVLGSSEFGIVKILTGDFTRLVVISIAIAVPVSYLVADNWLNSFAYHIDLEWWYFTGAGIATLLIAWFTVGIQTVKAALVNPAKILRSE